MRRSFLSVFLLLLILATTCSCNTKPKISDALESSFRELVAIDAMNESFQIYLDSPDEKNIKFGSVVKLSFRNISGQEVFFPVGHGIKLFVIKNNKWIEILNTVEYYGEGSLLQTKSEQASGGRIGAWVRPVLPLEIKTEGQEILRILVVGELLTNGEKTGIPIGAYIDLLISQ